MFDHASETALRWKRVWPMARKEFWEHVRNYWIAGIAGLLLVLLVVTAYLDALAAGHRGFTDFQATISNNTHLILPLVAIIGLMMGYGAVSNEVERGSMNVLLAKPISKTEVLVGKFFGLGAVLTAAIGVGVLAASIILIGVRPFYMLFTMPRMAHGGTQAAAGVIIYLPFAVLYGLAFLAIGIFVSTVARSRAQSIAGVIFVWFLFLIIWDAVLVGIKPVIASDPQALPNWYYAVELLNPVAVFRSISSRLVEANMQVLPPLEAWPGWFDLPVFFVMLVLYAVGPLVASIWVFRRQDL